ncbi:hypothetical protein CBR_g23353 [Chara braunii]|uniref:Nudix hydrolase domain-containing protein n=1 Tax=Chara braunii TaxID=69332 RepID=A0A388L405_CHABU|nr:hypothetical protein CBR_g23353 [Chara braunii]|eukprot:GBG77027.1 hypothetical protein CBR_g23353 [Chara braunii]
MIRRTSSQTLVWLLGVEWTGIRTSQKMLARCARSCHMSGLSSRIAAGLGNSAPAVNPLSQDIARWQQHGQLKVCTTFQHPDQKVSVRSYLSSIVSPPHSAPLSAPEGTSGFVKLRFPFTVHRCLSKDGSPRHRTFPFPTLSRVSAPISNIGAEWGTGSLPSTPPGWEFRCARELLGGERFSESLSSRMASHKPKPSESGMDRIGVAPLPPEECPIDEDEDVVLADFTPPLTEGMAEGVDATSLLAFEGDLYDGVIIDPTCLPADRDVFLSRLRSSLGLWASQQRKGVWLKLPRENANLVPLAISEGFDYHHAELHYVMLTKWLPPTPSTLPPNASHQVGVGAFVVNDKREILAVQEKYGFLRGKSIWKLPTGLVSQQEDIWTAAVREVKEETGIEAEFMEIITFRQAHSAAFGKSDLFMICSLKPLSFQITKQDSEIEAAQWMPLDEFLGQPFLQTRDMFMRMLMLCVAHLDGRYKGLRPINVPVGVDPSSTNIYCCDLTTETSGFFVKPH